MSIYERIRQMCRDNGETVTGLERTLGFARGSLSKIDRNSPSAGRLQRLADHFGVSSSYILTGETENGNTIDVAYYKPDTAKETQKVFEDPNLRLLFDAAKDSKPENIRLAAEMLQRFKEMSGE